MDGSQYQYYPKGSLAGFMLDVLIRDGSDNRRSLDDVMRELYRTAYKKGRGFTAADWWPAVSRAAGGRSFTEFNDEVHRRPRAVPLGRAFSRAPASAMAADTIARAAGRPRHRTGLHRRDRGEGVQPGGVAEAAGVKVGDHLLALGDVAIMDPSFGQAFRERFGKDEGDSLSDQGAAGRRHPHAAWQGQAGRAGRDQAGPGPEGRARRRRGSGTGSSGAVLGR